MIWVTTQHLSIHWNFNVLALLRAHLFLMQAFCQENVSANMSLACPKLHALWCPSSESKVAPQKSLPTLCGKAAQIFPSTKPMKRQQTLSSCVNRCKRNLFECGGREAHKLAASGPSEAKKLVPLTLWD